MAGPEDRLRDDEPVDREDYEAWEREKQRLTAEDLQGLVNARDGSELW